MIVWILVAALAGTVLLAGILWIALRNARASATATSRLVAEARLSVREAVAEETPAFLTSADETEEPFTSGDAVIFADEGLEQAIAAEQAAIARTQELFAEPAPDQFTVGRAIDEMLVYLESDQYKAGGNNVEGYDRHLASVGII